METYPKDTLAVSELTGAFIGAAIALLPVSVLVSPDFRTPLWIALCILFELVALPASVYVGSLLGNVLGWLGMQVEN
jgi:hypothetical protein